MKPIKFATIDDFSTDRIAQECAFRGLFKARYYIGAWCCPAVANLVWRIQAQKAFINKHVVDSIRLVESAVIKHINKQEDLPKRLKARYIADIKRACAIAREGL